MIKIRTREYTGPSPHAVAIRGRNPSKRPPEHLILERRKQDDKLAESVRQTEDLLATDIKLRWENSTTNKIHHNTVQRRLDCRLRGRQLELEERRQELRKILAEEDAYYIAQANSLKETLEEKQERMRKKAQELRAKREAERQKIVATKLDEQWKNQCEELRSVLSRRDQDQVCIERQHQLNVLAEMELERQAEEEMYAELWERDRLAKAAREERESQSAMERTYAMLDTLQQQRRENTIRREAEKRQIFHEAKEMQDDSLQLQEEMKKLSDIRLHKKMNYKKSLEKQIQIRSRAKKRDAKEELAHDSEVLTKAELDTERENIEAQKKKETRRLEEHKYRIYLEEQRKIEQQKEKEIEDFIQADVDKQKKKDAEKRRRKREARATYLQEVLNVRKQQVEQRREEQEEERKNEDIERERINRIIHDHSKIQKEDDKHKKIINRNYARDLVSQIEYQKERKRAEKVLEQREYEIGLLTEQSYESRLREVLERQNIQKIHPLRQHAMNNGRTIIFKD